MNVTLRSPKEIGLMRQAGLIVWEAHQAGARLVRPGASTHEVDAAIEAVFVKYGATPLFKGVPGKTPFPACSCISVNEEVVHGIPGPRKLAEGDVVSVDTGCKFQGWCGDSAYTYAVGKISPRAARLLEITKGALDLALEMMKTKRRWSQVAAEMEAYVKDAGFSVVENFVGHGIGREMHEELQVPNFVSKNLRRNGDFDLRPGVVIAIEPMVNMGTKRVRGLPDHWTQVTQDRQPSAHFEHTVAMTKDGPVALTDSPEAKA